MKNLVPESLNEFLNEAKVKSKRKTAAGEKVTLDQSGNEKAKQAIAGLKKELATAKKGFSMKTATAQDKLKVKNLEDRIAKWEAKSKKKLVEGYDDISISHNQTKRMGTGSTFQTNVINRLVNNFRMPVGQAQELFNDYKVNGEFTPEKMEAIQYNWDMIAWALSQELPLDDPTVLDRIR